MLILTFSVQLAVAERIGCWVRINPENPTESDEVNVIVNFEFLTYPPYVVDFGSISKNGNVFSVNVTIHVPKKDEVVLQMIHNRTFTYRLGKLDAGDYVFQVFVQTIHGSEDYWLEKQVEFTVSPSLEGAPEFPTYTFLLFTLALTSVALFIAKKFVQTSKIG
jgi:hypothetical protein